MLRNYLVVAWRNLLRHKLYSLINIAGLAVGITFCLLSYLFIRYEWNFDTFHKKADRIFLAYKDENLSRTRPKTWIGTPAPLAPTLQAEFPEVENTVIVDNLSLKEGTIVRCGDKVVVRSGLRVSPSFFEVFSFPTDRDYLDSALEDIHSVVVSGELARAFFGDGNPVGQVLSIQTGGGIQDFQVTGVVEPPGNSSLPFDFLLPFERMSDDWGACNYYTFVQLAEGVQATEFEKKLRPFAARHFADDAADLRRELGDGYEMRMHLVPLTGIHLNPGIAYDLTPTSDPAYSYVLSGIALAVLLIACVNFTNLSVGLASTRFKEVGMRQVLGATRTHLVTQFWGEAVLLSLLTLVIGIALAELILPVFNGLVGKELKVDYGASWPILLGLALVVGLVTGSYPSLMLSGFHPVVVLRGKLKIGGANLFSRGLVVLQFVLSVVLVIAALMMSRQMEYLRTRNLGFNPEQVIVIDTFGLDTAERSRALDAFRRAAEQRGDVIAASLVNRSFGRGGDWGTDRSYEGRIINIRSFVIDYDYVETLGMELVEGRDFSRVFQTDRDESIMINESLLKALGWDSAVGRELPFYRGKTIIGVVKDFHFKPLRQGIEAAWFTLQQGNGSMRFILVRIDPDDIPRTLAFLKETWNQVSADHPFVYSFLNEEVERQFRAEERWVEIVRFSSLLAVFIACLGMLGLTSLAVARRTKEIGIRKVLGASVPSIVVLLSREFTYLVLAANLVAWPVAYFAMHRWLQSFAYRVELGLGVFLLGGLLALGIAWLTVSYQAIRAAMANPVEALRYE